MLKIGVFAREISGRICNLNCSKDVAYFVNEIFLSIQKSWTEASY